MAISLARYHYSSVSRWSRDKRWVLSSYSHWYVVQRMDCSAPSNPSSFFSSSLERRSPLRGIRRICPFILLSLRSSIYSCTGWVQWIEGSAWCENIPFHLHSTPFLCSAVGRWTFSRSLYQFTSVHSGDQQKHTEVPGLSIHPMIKARSSRGDLFQGDMRMSLSSMKSIVNELMDGEGSGEIEEDEASQLVPFFWNCSRLASLSRETGSNQGRHESMDDWSSLCFRPSSR